MINVGKQNILGIRIDAIDYEASVEKIINAAKAREPLAVSALAVHGVMTGVMDAEHRHRLNHLDLIVPDGQPIRWAMRWLHGVDLPDRVYGPNLMLQTCLRAAEEELSIFLFGGTQELLDELERNLKARFSNLHVAGKRPSRFRQLSETERDEVVSEIQNSGASITFIGLGCPRQEVWAYEFRSALSMPLLAVGAAFSFHAGRLDQAPPFFQDHGLEWSYRLLKEPRRLWKRYLFLNPLYLSLLAMQRTGVRSFDPNDSAPPTKHLLYG